MTKYEQTHELHAHNTNTESQLYEREEAGSK